MEADIVVFLIFTFIYLILNMHTRYSGSETLSLFNYKANNDHVIPYILIHTLVVTKGNQINALHRQTSKPISQKRYGRKKHLSHPAKKGVKSLLLGAGMERILGSYSNVLEYKQSFSRGREPCGSLGFTIQGVWQAWTPSFWKEITRETVLIFLEPWELNPVASSGVTMWTSWGDKRSILIFLEHSNYLDKRLHIRSSLYMKSKKFIAEMKANIPYLYILNISVSQNTKAPTEYQEI